MVVGGFVAYFGESMEARALSRFWAGSAMGKKLIEANASGLRKALDLILSSCW